MSIALFELDDFDETRPAAQPLATWKLEPTTKVTIRHIEKFGAAHGCAECGIAPAPWSDAYLGYMDGMGRLTRCSYCPSCAGSGWTLLRDPWTDAPVSSWHEVPCSYCYGGWSAHAWNCSGHPDEGTYRVDPYRVTVYGTDSHGRVYFPGEIVQPDVRRCINAQVVAS